MSEENVEKRIASWIDDATPLEDPDPKSKQKCQNFYDFCCLLVTENIKLIRISAL